ncbi:MAG: potassium transporter TrkA [Desulfuromonadaceae bacterium GWC2_58_13]|nr:MAG: potassium transporter TrkA [Desulfuromonadaceae bacterium GWC2_58_13]
MRRTQRFCVIGLGNFGFHVARTLFNNGHEVVAIDLDQEKIQRVQDHASYSVIGDAASKEFLNGQGVGEMDAVIVSTGERSHLATLITLYLKELKVPRILVKAISEDHGRILEKVGATEVIFPEKDMAIKIARGLASPNILEFIPLAEEYSITEAGPPKHFLGKSLIELDLRKKHQVTLIGIKDVLTDQFTPVPPPTHVIKDSDLLIFIGKSIDIEKALRTK